MEKLITLERDFHFYNDGGKFICQFELDGNVVSMKKVVVHEDMSEETLCFTADVYFNGKKVGVAKNNGCGGCANFYGTDDEYVKDFYQFSNGVIPKQNKYCFPKWKMNMFDMLDYLANYQYDCNRFEGDIEELMNYLQCASRDLESIREEMLSRLNKTA